MAKVMEKGIVEQLRPIFEPRSVAVIGASSDTSKFGGRVVLRPLETGYRGTLYPVNPQRSEIGGVKAYPTVLDIPDTVDMAIIAVAAPMVPKAMEECVKKGVKGVVLISAGFAEVGENGKKLQDEVVRIAHSAGIRVVGPNSNGIWSSRVKLNLLFTVAPRPGSISFISQSGTMGFYLFELANSKGYGFSKFASSGNQASLDVSDYLEYLAQDEDTRVIVLYLEGIQHGKRFFEVAREVARVKPIIVYKGGRSSAGSRAAMSHTASLSGSDELFNAACKQAGIIRCYEVVHPFDLAEALASQPLPKGKRVAVLGTGGQCVAIADACASLGLELPELDDDTKRELMEILPPHSPVPTNPVDSVASGIKMTIPRITEVLARLDYIDGIITQGLWAGFYTTPGRIKQLVSEAEIVTSIPDKYGKPVVCTQVAMRLPSGEIVIDLYRKAGIPSYTTPEESARAMWGLMCYGEIRRQLGVSG